MPRTKEPPIPLDVLERVAAVLRVLAHPHRLKIVELLGDHDLTVGELAEHLGLAHSACSQHLSLMRAHGILSVRREGKTAYYQVEDPNALNVIKCIRKHAL